MAAIRRPTERLKADHQDVLERLRNLERVIDGLDDPDGVARDLRALGAFFETKIWDHFQKEEEALFPEIETFLPREKGPTGQMLREHAELRQRNEGFQRGIAGYLGDPTDGEAADLVRENGRYIIDLLRNHIHKEDNVLFKMADVHLSEAQNRQIIDLFETIEAEGA